MFNKINGGVKRFEIFRQCNFSAAGRVAYADMIIKAGLRRSIKAAVTVGQSENFARLVHRLLYDISRAVRTDILPFFIGEF